jgi:hypothetical protein
MAVDQPGFPQIDSFLDEYKAQCSISGFMTRNCLFDLGFTQAHIYLRHFGFNSELSLFMPQLQVQEAGT